MSHSHSSYNVSSATKMTSKLILTLALIIQIYSIYGQDGIKSSLTFVIDDSGSMGYEINEVREKIDTIYDSAMRANDSLIENFVLITFNDPDAQVRTITKDRDELKTALAEIEVRGGGDCPEYSLTGIKLALEFSLPYSSVFVFTDASSKDYRMFEEVKSLAESKRIRLFFILTGICRSIYEANYQVYHQLAKATDGQVFNVLKNNVNDIIPIVIQNIRSRRHVLIPAEQPKIYSKKFSFTVYSETDEVFIYVRGQRARIQIFDAEGKNVDFVPNRRINGVLIVKVQRTKPGLYAAEVVSTSEISVQVLGSTSVNFLNE